MKSAQINEFHHSLKGVNHIYVVGSGKGGEGKSTISVNLAAALLLRGNRVGVLDADIYGPSISPLMSAHDPSLTPDKCPALSVQNFGIQLITLEGLMPRKQAGSLQGKAVAKTMGRLIRKVELNNLDFLIVDLPSGTGDIQNMVLEALNPDGAVIVTTPHQVCREDVQRCINMFEQQDVPITGLVENMVSWTCEKCGHVESFYTGLADRWCQVETIAVLPMDRSVWESAQKGVPLVFDAVNSDLKRTFDRVAARLEYKHIELSLSKK